VSPAWRKPERVGGLVTRVLGDLGLDSSARVVRLAECWERAVGPEVARHCHPTALDRDRLEVTVDSSSWCQQLQLQRGEILAALREVAGDDAPAALWLRVGGVGDPDRAG
jgi:predicted nucleic acid-binding Zn ribbon protein